MDLRWSYGWNTLGLAIFIDVGIIRSIGWFFGIIRLNRRLQAKSALRFFWDLNKIIAGLIFAICLLTSTTLELAFYHQELSKLVETREAAILKRDRLHREIQELTDGLWVSREKLPNVIQADINRLLARRIRLRGEINNRRPRDERLFPNIALLRHGIVQRFYICGHNLPLLLGRTK